MINALLVDFVIYVEDKPMILSSNHFLKKIHPEFIRNQLFVEWFAFRPLLLFSFVSLEDHLSQEFYLQL